MCEIRRITLCIELGKYHGISFDQIPLEWNQQLNEQFFSLFNSLLTDRNGFNSKSN